MAFSAGLFDKLYYNTTADNTVPPTLVEVDAIDDLDSPSERNAISVKLRRYDTELNLLGQMKKSITFKMATEPGSTVWQAFEVAHRTAVPIEVYAFYYYIDNAGQPDTGSKALRMTCYVSKFSIGQPFEGLDVNDCELVPSANAVDPTQNVVEPEIYTAA